jgi:hypothetical protein
MIDKSTVGDVIKAGVWSWKDICTGPAAKTDDCKQNAGK